jgi:hypothetical protein
MLMGKPAKYQSEDKEDKDIPLYFFCEWGPWKPLQGSSQARERGLYIYMLFQPPVKLAVPAPAKSTLEYDYEFFADGGAAARNVRMNVRAPAGDDGRATRVLIPGAVSNGIAHTEYWVEIGYGERRGTSSFGTVDGWSRRLSYDGTAIGEAFRVFHQQCRSNREDTSPPPPPP